MTSDEYTIQEAFIDVGDGHQLYTQEWGNPKAKSTMLLVHGGPGSQSKDKHKLAFNPSQHHVIFFDQRGCGQSLPYGSLKNNTTPDLVEDINKILKHYKVDEAVLVGGSWGATLALAYAVAHPARVEALVLNGIFTGSQSEIEWLDKGRFKNFYPDAWETFLARTPKSHHDDPVAYHTKRVLGEDAQARAESGFAYETLEGSVMSLDDRRSAADPTDFDPLPIRMEMFYMQKDCFMPDRHVFNNAHKLTMPVWLVQGRYDMVCPPVTAYELHQKLPNSNLIWTIGGHFAAERGTADVIKTILMHFN
jgi:proline iminopeptidase